MSSDLKKTKQEANTIWVLTDAAPAQGAQTLLPAVPSAIDPHKLGDQLQEFVIAFSKSLNRVQEASVSGYSLSEVSVDVKLTANLGVVLIAQAGITGGITLTFKRK
jgi:hypothetical protein